MGGGAAVALVELDWFYGTSSSELCCGNCYEGQSISFATFSNSGSCLPPSVRESMVDWIWFAKLTGSFFYYYSELAACPELSLVCAVELEGVLKDWPCSEIFSVELSPSATFFAGSSPSVFWLPSLSPSPLSVAY